ncbi:MAG: AAA family ATPase [Candidatus Omnitrophica bacterium]|nr:AAA family ATPase [Candidatus Omnitrophota bacterium]
MADSLVEWTRPSGLGWVDLPAVYREMISGSLREIRRRTRSSKALLSVIGNSKYGIPNRTETFIHLLETSRDPEVRKMAIASYVTMVSPDSRDFLTHMDKEQIGQIISRILKNTGDDPRLFAGVVYLASQLESLRRKSNQPPGRAVARKQRQEILKRLQVMSAGDFELSLGDLVPDPQIRRTTARTIYPYMRGITRYEQFFDFLDATSSLVTTARKLEGLTGTADWNRRFGVVFDAEEFGGLDVARLTEHFVDQYRRMSSFELFLRRNAFFEGPVRILNPVPVFWIQQAAGENGEDALKLLNDCLVRVQNRPSDEQGLKERMDREIEYLYQGLRLMLENVPEERRSAVVMNHLRRRAGVSPARGLTTGARVGIDRFPVAMGRWVPGVGRILFVVSLPLTVLWFGAVMMSVADGYRSLTGGGVSGGFAGYLSRAVSLVGWPFVVYAAMFWKGFIEFVTAERRIRDLERRYLREYDDLGQGALFGALGSIVKGNLAARALRDSGIPEAVFYADLYEGRIRSARETIHRELMRAGEGTPRVRWLVRALDPERSPPRVVESARAAVAEQKNPGVVRALLEIRELDPSLGVDELDALYAALLDDANNVETARFLCEKIARRFAGRSFAEKLLHEAASSDAAKAVLIHWATSRTSYPPESMDPNLKLIQRARELLSVASVDQLVAWRVPGTDQHEARDLAQRFVKLQNYGHTHASEDLYRSVRYFTEHIRSFDATHSLSRDVRLRTTLSPLYEVILDSDVITELLRINGRDRFDQETVEFLTRVAQTLLRRDDDLMSIIGSADQAEDYRLLLGVEERFKRWLLTGPEADDARMDEVTGYLSEDARRRLKTRLGRAGWARISDFYAESILITAAYLRKEAEVIPVIQKLARDRITGDVITPLPEGENPSDLWDPKFLEKLWDEYIRNNRCFDPLDHLHDIARWRFMAMTTSGRVLSPELIERLTLRPNRNALADELRSISQIISDTEFGGGFRHLAHPRILAAILERESLSAYQGMIRRQITGANPSGDSYRLSNLRGVTEEEFVDFMVRFIRLLGESRWKEGMALFRGICRNHPNEIKPSDLVRINDVIKLIVECSATANPKLADREGRREAALLYLEHYPGPAGTRLSSPGLPDEDSDLFDDVIESLRREGIEVTREDLELSQIPRHLKDALPTRHIEELKALITREGYKSEPEAAYLFLNLKKDAGSATFGLSYDMRYEVTRADGTREEEIEQIFMPIVRGEMPESQYWELVQHYLQVLFEGKRTTLTRSEQDTVISLSVDLNRKVMDLVKRFGGMGENTITFRELVRFNVDFSRYYLQQEGLENVLEMFILTAFNVYGRAITDPRAKWEFMTLLSEAFQAREYKSLFGKAMIDSPSLRTNLRQRIEDIIAYADYENLGRSPGADEVPLEVSLRALIERASQVSRPLLLKVDSDNSPVVEDILESLDEGDGRTVRLSASGFTRRRELFGMHLPKKNLTMAEVQRLVSQSAETSPRRIRDALKDILDLDDKEADSYYEYWLGDPELRQDRVLRLAIATHLKHSGSWRELMEWRDGILVRMAEAARQDPDRRYHIIIDNVEALPDRVRVQLNPVLWEKMVEVPDRGQKVVLPPNLQFIFTMHQDNAIQDDSFMNRPLVQSVGVPVPEAEVGRRSAALIRQTGLDARSASFLARVYHALRRTRYEVDPEIGFRHIYAFARAFVKKYPDGASEETLGKELHAYLKGRFVHAAETGLLNFLIRPEAAWPEPAVAEAEITGYLSIREGLDPGVERFLWDVFMSLKRKSMEENFDLSFMDLIEIARRIRGRSELEGCKQSEIARKEAYDYLYRRMTNARDRAHLEYLKDESVTTPRIQVAQGQIVFDGVGFDMPEDLAECADENPEATAEEVIRIWWAKRHEGHGFVTTELEVRVFGQLARDVRFGSGAAQLEGPSGEGKTEMGRVFSALIGNELRETTVNEETNLAEFRGQIRVTRDGRYELYEPEYLRRLAEGGNTFLFNEINTNQSSALYYWLYPEVTRRKRKYLPEFAPTREGGPEVRQETIARNNLWLYTVNPESFSGRNATPPRVSAHVPRYHVAGNPDELRGIVEGFFRNFGLEEHLSRYAGVLHEIHLALQDAKKNKHLLNSPQAVTRREFLRVLKRFASYLEPGVPAEEAFAAAVEEVYVYMWKEITDKSRARKIVHEILGEKGMPPAGGVNLKRAFRSALQLDDKPLMVFSNATTAPEDVINAVREADPEARIKRVPLSFFHRKRQFLRGFVPAVAKSGIIANAMTVLRKWGFLRRLSPQFDLGLGLLPQAIEEARFERAGGTDARRTHYLLLEQYTRLNPQSAPLLNEFLQTGRLESLEEEIAPEIAERLFDQIRSREEADPGLWESLRQQYSDVNEDAAALSLDEASQNAAWGIGFARWCYCRAPSNLRVVATGSSQEKTFLSAAEIDRFTCINVAEPMDEGWVRRYAEERAQSLPSELRERAAGVVVEAFLQYEAQAQDFWYEHNRT